MDLEKETFCNIFMKESPKGGYPFGEFQPHEWHISLANAFFSIYI